MKLDYKKNSCIVIFMILGLSNLVYAETRGACYIKNTDGKFHCMDNTPKDFCLKGSYAQRGFELKWVKNKKCKK